MITPEQRNLLISLRLQQLEAMFADMKLFISTIKAWLEANPA